MGGTLSLWVMTFGSFPAAAGPAQNSSRLSASSSHLEIMTAAEASDVKMAESGDMANRWDRVAESEMRDSNY